jgi:AAA+ superfamily predicted ATPase
VVNATEDRKPKLAPAALAVAKEIAELLAVGTPAVFVVTTEEARALAVVDVVARALQAQVAVWSSARGLEPIAPKAVEPLAALDALVSAKGPLVTALLDFHHALEEPRVVRRMRDVLSQLAESRRHVVIVAPRLVLPEGLANDVAVVRLPLPEDAELAVALDAIAQQPLEEHARHRAVQAARGLSLTQAKRAFLRATRTDPTLEKAGLSVILVEKRRMLAEGTGIEHVDVHERPEDIGGLEIFKAWLAERALAFAPDARKFGLPAPRGVLLVGVQGCGKSLSAKCVAQHFRVPLLRLDLPRVLGASAGASAEENLARALAAAESIAPVCLWVDEIEKGFAGSSSDDSRAARLLGAFSTWLQERRSSVFVVATANDVTRLPPELLRRGRFDELFFVDLPDEAARRTILAVHLRRRGRDPLRFDLASLADLCANYSGAELEQVVVGALHRAFAAQRELTDADLRRVAQDLVPLYRTYEEQIKAIREWARGRCRLAGQERGVVELFRRVE